MNDKTIRDNCTPTNDCESSILVQSGSAKKITDLQELSPVNGTEFVVVAVGNQNFKVAVSEIAAAGSTGASGFSGLSAFSGFSASSAFSGFSGMTINGASGFSGVSGFSGQGQSGVSGFSAFSGFSGDGISGFSGVSGLGISGFSGYSGTSGLGLSGYSGLSGRLTVAGVGFVVRVNDSLNTYATRTWQFEPPLEIVYPAGLEGNPTIYYDETCAVNSYFSITPETTAGTENSYANGYIYTLAEAYQTQNILDNRTSSDTSIRSYSDSNTYYEMCANVTLELTSANAGAQIVLAIGDGTNPLIESVVTIPLSVPDTFVHTIQVSGLIRLDNAEQYYVKLYFLSTPAVVTCQNAPRSYLTVKGVIK